MMKKYLVFLFIAAVSIPAYGQSPEQKIQELGIVLPPAGKPIANYVKYVRVGNLIYLSGHGPQKTDGKYITGKLGNDLTIEEGYEAARLTGINILATIKDAVGDLHKVKRIIKVLGMVNSTGQFTDHPKVMNGFSDLMVTVFAEKGKHARSAVGLNSLPGGMCIEIEVILEVE